MPVLSHLRHLFNVEQCQAYIHRLRWKDRPLQCPRCQSDHIGRWGTYQYQNPPDLGFLSPFGDITLWNILVSCIVFPYISPYSHMTNRILWGPILSVAPETSSMEGGPRFHLDTGHHCPDSLVT